LIKPREAFASGEPFLWSIMHIQARQEPWRHVFFAMKLMISENSRVVFAYIYCLIKGSSAKRHELLNWRPCTSAWLKCFLRRVLFLPLFCS